MKLKPRDPPYSISSCSCQEPQCFMQPWSITTHRKLSTIYRVVHLNTVLTDFMPFTIVAVCEMSRLFLVVLLLLQVMFLRGGSARPSACGDKETDMKCYYCSSHYDKPKIYEECCIDEELRKHCFNHIWIEPKRDRQW